jgi:serine/threonine-protein kinase
MEFISGHSLKQEVEQHGVFTEEKLKKIIFKVGQALNYIHEKNILHLDIKPSNILMDKNNNPKLIDFGISKKYDLSNAQETSTTLLAASKGYASIEQYDSEGIQVFSPRPDIYSLGATMYFLMTGHVPTESIFRSTKGLQNPRDFNPAISEKMEHVILKAMALNASDRYQTVMELLLDLGFDPATDTIDPASVSLPEYPEFASKMTEPYDVDAEDETMIRSNSFANSRQNKHRWIYLAVPLLISGLLAFVIFSNFGKKLPDKSLIIPTPVVNHPDSTNKTTSSQEIPPVNASKTEPKSIPENPAQTPTPEQIKQDNYQKTFAEALAAYNQRNFDRALALIDKAESYMKTTDTKQYKTLIIQEKEKIEIQNRKNLYEEWMKFGNFVVVKKKSNGLVGAIDEKGQEKIPCKYASTESSGVNRLFQKDNNLYDLYDPSGVLIKENTNGFE